MNRTTALFSALLCTSAPAWAGDKPLYQPVPDWVAPAAMPDPAKQTDASPATVIYDQQHRISDGQVWAYSEVATRAVSPQSLAGMGTVQLEWQPDAGDLIVHRAEIVRGGERIDLIAKGQTFEVLRREEQLEQLMINGTLTATLTVEGLRVGDILRIAYSTTDRDKTLKGNAQTMIPLMAAPGRAGFARARLSWPAGDKLSWRYHADGTAPKPVRKGGFDEVELSLPLAKPADLPPDAPARFRKLMMIEASSFADWQSVSRTMAPLYQTDMAVGAEVKAEAAKIAAKSADPRMRAALALRLVQDEVRYLYRGLDGGNYTPQAAADTWSRRYGDCKAKTLLLLTLLRELGIAGEAVLVNSTLGDAVPERLPSAAAFDHVVVRATIAGKPVWLDGTGSGTRLGDLDDVPAFRNVLPLRIAGAEVETLATQPPGRPAVETLVEVDQRAGVNLPALVTITFTMRGAMAEMMRTASAQATAEQLTEAAQRMANGVMGNMLLNGRSVSYDADSATGTMTATGVVGSQWRMRDGRYRLMLDKTLGQMEFAPDRARPAWKDIPVVIAPGPFAGTLRQRVRLPGGGTGFEVEGDRSFAAPLAGMQIARSVTVADGVIAIEDRLSTAGREIPPAELAAMRAQVVLAKKRLLEAVAPAKVPPRWKVAMTGGKAAFKPLMEAYARAIALEGDDPNSVNAYLNRASFLGGTYDAKAALVDLDRVIAKEPTAERHFWRARLRNTIGDADGARADAEAGLALQPDAGEGVGLLASLRFDAGEHDVALAMLDERIAAGGKDKADYQEAKALMLGEAKRVAEGSALMDEVVAAKPGSPSVLNGRCWFRGTMNVELEGALKDCTRAIELAENPAAYLDSRAMVYFRMQRMDEALADLDAALETAPELASSLFLRGIIRKRRGDAGAAEDLAAARLISPQIDKRFGRWGIIA
ncbi:DUF3857 domain-containing protein [Sphingomonas turrisvirgatae]|uniref:DUF3857 domain-containing protein n=1 Tax=Sphingomonas turrisvirgatae TaxID=1888892 RepID=A0A1E3LT22_9SPHN|nr:DUF3857 domain-containing protein [Sphingomonas turrisvirgatae]ODP36922.1 hypothetical protein BFL28_04235 [Sphingomonas turrisvirgatae]